MKFDPYYISLLRECGVSEIVVMHCIAVADYVDEVATKMLEMGEEIDIELAVNGALLHDIGRSHSHDVTHGIEGAKIVRQLGLDEAFARICERHIGAGIPDDEAKALGFPPGCYIPVTKEEKLIANCDNLISGVERVGISEVLDKFRKRLGEHTLDRVERLYKEFEGFM